MNTFQDQTSSNSFLETLEDERIYHGALIIVACFLGLDLFDLNIPKQLQKSFQAFKAFYGVLVFIYSLYMFFLGYSGLDYSINIAEVSFSPSVICLISLIISIYFTTKAFPPETMFKITYRHNTNHPLYLDTSY